MSNLTLFVVGFIFSEDYKRVVLIRKNRPEWQKGKLNGVGGHVLGNETFVTAICREIKEEVDIDVPFLFLERNLYYNKLETSRLC